MGCRARVNDEINLVKPGFNGGFEAIQGQSVYTPAAPADLVDFNGTGIYRDPEFVWTQKVVPVGLSFLASNKLGAEQLTLGKGFGGISSLTVGPDGYLDVVSFGDEAIYRVAPA